MNTLERLVREAEETPEPILEEVLDFLRFLKLRPPPAIAETALLSEEALARDWLRPEEDEAWAYLSEATS
jgi:hypothetical protein